MNIPESLRLHQLWLAGDPSGVQFVAAGADLSGADLRWADLSGADLSGAYLYGADLRRADLRSADLSGAVLTGSDLTGAIIDDGSVLVGPRPVFQIGPIGSERRTLVAYVTDGGIRLRAGCFFGTVEQFTGRLNSTHGSNEHAREYRAALDMIRSHAELWGTPAPSDTSGAE